MFRVQRPHQVSCLSSNAGVCSNSFPPPPLTLFAQLFWGVAFSLQFRHAFSFVCLSPLSPPSPLLSPLSPFLSPLSPFLSPHLYSPLFSLLSPRQIAHSLFPLLIPMVASSCLCLVLVVFPSPVLLLPWVCITISCTTTTLGMHNLTCREKVLLSVAQHQLVCV